MPQGPCGFRRANPAENGEYERSRDADSLNKRRERSWLAGDWNSDSDMLGGDVDDRVGGDEGLERVLVGVR